MARPKKEIDIEQVIELAKIHCTYAEIAAVLKCSVDTLERRFADTIKNARESGKMSLRRWQFKAAESGNTGMLVWLGKQYLEQSDKLEQKQEIEQKVKAEIVYESEWGSIEHSKDKA